MSIRQILAKPFIGTLASILITEDKLKETSSVLLQS
jgi:hypothetical protein